MKRLIIFLALIAFSTAVFGQEPAHKFKAKVFAEETAKITSKMISGEATQDDQYKLFKLGEEMGQYMIILNDQTKISEFFTAYGEYTYVYFEKYGLSKEMADQYLSSFLVSLITELTDPSVDTE